MRRGEPFKSDALTSAFVGRSQCNSGFLVAALRAEGLFQADPEHKGMSKLSGDLDAWEVSLRGMAPPLVGGGPVTAKLHPEPRDTKFRPKRADGVRTKGEIPYLACIGVLPKRRVEQYKKLRFQKRERLAMS